MKRFKSPVTVILTTLSVIPLFIGSLIAGSTLWLPLGALAVLLFVHFLFGIPSKNDEADNNIIAALDKHDTTAAMSMPVAAASRGGSFSVFGISHIKKDKRYHAGVICWLVVFSSYIFFSIMANASLYGDMAAIKSELYMPFFLGSAALAAGDAASYFLKDKKSVLYRVMLAAALIIGAYFFYLGVLGLVI